jgi:hypothetical protein
MTRATIADKAETRKRKRNPRVKFHGICADAVSLGVCRQYLFDVLTGRKQSRSLTVRYEALKGTQ